MANHMYMGKCIRQWDASIRDFFEGRAIVDWELGFRHDKFTIALARFEDFERLIAMLEFYSKYESESFELFYKWFKQNKGKED